MFLVSCTALGVIQKPFTGSGKEENNPWSPPPLLLILEKNDSAYERPNNFQKYTRWTDDTNCHKKAFLLNRHQHCFRVLVSTPIAIFFQLINCMYIACTLHVHCTTTENALGMNAVNDTSVTCGVCVRKRDRERGREMMIMMVYYHETSTCRREFMAYHNITFQHDSNWCLDDDDDDFMGSFALVIENI